MFRGVWASRFFPINILILLIATKERKSKMSATAAELTKVLTEKLHPQHLVNKKRWTDFQVILINLTKAKKVDDESGGCGEKFEIEIVSSEFEGKGLLDRHRYVNELLKAFLPKIHALSLKTLTPEQWEKKKNTNN